MLVTALVLFVGVGVFAFRSLSLPPSGIRWLPLLVAALVGVPAIALLNAAEFHLMASFAGVPTSMRTAFEVSVAGTAANLLPVPGAALIRLHRMVEAGASMRRAAGATAFVGITWISVSTGSASLLAASQRRYLLAAGLAAGSLTTALVARLLFRKEGGRPSRPRLIIVLVAVELATLTATALRLWLILRGLGVRASLAQTVVVGVSSALASAVGVFPGGVGLMELLAGGLAPLVGLPAAAGVASATINRLMGVVVHAFLAIGLVLSKRSPSRALADDAAPVI